MSFFDLSASKTRARARLFSNSSIPKGIVSRERISVKSRYRRSVGDPLLTLLLVQTSMIPWGFAADAFKVKSWS